MKHIQLITVEMTEGHKKVKIVSMILLVGFAIALSLVYVQGHILKMGYPFDTFLYRPVEIFSDFDSSSIVASNPYHRDIITVSETSVFQQIQPADSFLGSGLIPTIINGETYLRNIGGPLYFPFAYWITSIFHLFPADLAKIVFFEFCFVLFAAICFIHVYKQAGLAPTAIIFFLSYPFIILLDRANFEIFVFFFLYIFIFFYKRKPILAMIALACAIAMKLFPVFFVLIYLSDKKYRETIFTLGIALILNLLGYSLYPGGLVNNILSHLLNLRVSSMFINLDGRDVMFDHSWLAMLKYLVYSLSSRPNNELVSALAGKLNNLTIPVIVLLVSILVCFHRERVLEKSCSGYQFDAFNAADIGGLPLNTFIYPIFFVVGCEYFFAI